MILTSRRVTTDNTTVNHIEIIHGSAYEIIHNILGLQEICAEWFTKRLTEDLKRNCLDICQRSLDRYGNEGNVFLKKKSLEMKLASTTSNPRVNIKVF